MSKIQRSEVEIIRILKEAENGVPVPEVCRTYGMGRATFYKWRSRYSGCDASLISEMKSLEGYRWNHKASIEFIGNLS